MATILRQSTQIKVRIGPAVAVGDGFTPVTTLSLSTADEAELLKADGAATVSISGATFAAVTGSDGWYDLTLTTSHTDTVGELVVVINDDSLILPIYQRFQVIEEAIYDALFASGANAYAGAAGSTTLGAGAITATVIATGAIDADAIADNAIDAGAIAADAITAAKIANGAIDAATFAADVDAEILSYIVDDATRIDASSLNTATVTTIPAILVDTAEIGAAGAGLTAVPWNASWDAEVQSEVEDGLAAYGAALQSTLTAVAGYIDTEIQTILNTMALESTAQAILVDTGTSLPATLATIEGKVDTADAAIDSVATTIGVAGAGLTEAGGTGDHLTALATQTSVDDLPTNAELTAALAAADDAILAAIAALNNLSAAQVNAEVVDALAADTYAEPGQGAPAATASLAAKLNYLYKAWRNKKTQTSTTFSLFADDGTTVDQKSTTSDDGTTTTIGEIATGP